MKSVMEAAVADIDTRGEGQPYVILNGLGWTRDMVVELAVAPGAALNAPAVYDGNGTQLPAELTTAEKQTVLRVRVPEVPAFGYATVWLREEEQPGADASDAGNNSISAANSATFEDRWETCYYWLQLNELGEIISLYDKEAGREIVKSGEALNRLHFFHDRPILWDAWDIDSRYEEQPAGAAVLLEKRLLSTGPVCDVLFFRWSLGQSEIQQEPDPVSR